MKKAGVIGWPIEHSRSPLIHGHWLKRYAIDGSYERIAVRPEEVAAFCGSLAERGMAGCNVTLPHKEAAFAAAAVRHPSAVAVGAANTMWLEGGKLHCANSDTYGFMTHLGNIAPGWSRTDAPVAILGAGGSSRAIIYGFLEAGVGEVRIFNRTAARAEELAAHFGTRVKVRDWRARAAGIADVSVLVNTTSLGMAKTGPLDIDLSGMRADGVVADIVYVPLETDLLRRARARGLVGVDGLGMLLHQGARAFQIWTGREADVAAMRAALEQYVYGKHA